MIRANQHFKAFLQKASFSNSIIECMLDFNDLGVEMGTLDSANVCMIRYSMKKEGFTEYEPIGKIGIKMPGHLAKKLAGFDGDFEIKQEDYDLKLFDKTRFLSDRMIDTEVLQDKTKGKEVIDKVREVCSVSVRISRKVLERALDDASLMSTSKLGLSVKDSVFSIGSENDVGDNSRIEVPAESCEGKDAKTMIAKEYLNKVPPAIIGDTVILSFGNDSPLVVSAHDDLFSCDIVIANLGDNT